MLLILTRIWQKLLFVELIFSEFNPKTMKSTRIPNLYLAGVGSGFSWTDRWLQFKDCIFNRLFGRFVSRIEIVIKHQ